MEQSAVPVAEQVREVVPAVVEALHEPKAGESSPLVAANSFEAEALRTEIIRVGRKLWERQYVDGNGGNISARLGSKYVLCTPTMLSKGASRAALPSALRHGLCHHRLHAARWADSRV